jgi:hypothetical protein
MRRVDLIVMNGRAGESDVERMVGEARRAITLDLIDKALVSDVFASIVVSTADGVLAEEIAGRTTVVVELDPEGERFHFGRRLQLLVSKYGMERVVYFGGASAPLVPVSILREIADRLREADRLFLANNFYSVDFCAFTPASTLLAVDPPENDNGLGWLLGGKAKLTARELERTGATMFDVDTPIDLLILSLHPMVSPHTRTHLDGLALDVSRLEAALPVFLDSHAEILVSGRVSSKTMGYLEREVLCRTRVFSEERGMRASGRLARNEVRSLLGTFMARVGVGPFFTDMIPQFGQAAFIDDRVLWAHLKLWPNASDRFNSDLLNPDAIVDPFIREFTEGAIACPVPVVLGGHSLVSGGLYVLVEAAWARSGRDIPRLVETV